MISWHFFFLHNSRIFLHRRISFSWADHWYFQWRSKGLLFSSLSRCFNSLQLLRNPHAHKLFTCIPCTGEEKPFCLYSPASSHHLTPKTSAISSNSNVNPQLQCKCGFYYCWWWISHSTLSGEGLYQNFGAGFPQSCLPLRLIWWALVPEAVG